MHLGSDKIVAIDAHQLHEELDQAHKDGRIRKNAEKFLLRK